MATRYYFDADGAYLGGLDESLDPPENSDGYTDSGPNWIGDIWNGAAWTGSPPPTLTDSTDAVAFQLLYNNAPWELFALFPLLKFYGDVPASRMGCWAIVKGQSPAWLTQEWIDNMESYCAANNMALVP